MVSSKHSASSNQFASTDLCLDAAVPEGQHSGVNFMDMQFVDENTVADPLSFRSQDWVSEERLGSEKSRFRWKFSCADQP